MFPPLLRRAIEARQSELSGRFGVDPVPLECRIGLLHVVFERVGGVFSVDGPGAEEQRKKTKRQELARETHPHNLLGNLLQSSVLSRPSYAFQGEIPSAPDGPAESPALPRTGKGGAGLAIDFIKKINQP